MAFTTPWDESFPADTQLAKLGAQDMRTIQTNVRERIVAFSAGLAANRPTPEAIFAGVTYLSTDINKLEQWDGAAWIDITNVIQAMLVTGAVLDGARVYNTVVQSIANSVFTALSFSAARYDSNTLFSLSNPTRLTCKRAGKYLIWGSVQFTPNATGGRQAGFTLNGATPGSSFVALDPVVASLTTGVVCKPSCIQQLALNDYVELLVAQDSGGPLNVLSTSGAAPAQQYSPEFGMQFLSL